MNLRLKVMFVIVMLLCVVPILIVELTGETAIDCEAVYSQLRTQLACQLNDACWKPQMQEKLNDTWTFADKHCFKIKEE